MSGKNPPMRMKSFLTTAVSLLATTLSALLPVQGAVVSSNPTADAFVTTGSANDLATNNYGGAGALALSAAGSSKGEFQSVLRFDTSGAKSTSTQSLRRGFVEFAIRDAATHSRFSE